MTEPAEAPPLTRDQATAMVGKHVLVVLEEIIKAHELVALDETKSQRQKDDARLVIAAAQAFGRPLFHVVKAAEKPRVFRPSSVIRIAR
jgi:hypothetical protein